MCGSVALDLLQLALAWCNYPLKEGQLQVSNHFQKCVLLV